VAPRAYLKGYLKLSLVSCPVALFPATSEREKVSFHQLNKNTGHRIRYTKVDAETEDEVESADIIKGYEVSKGDYIELDPEELDAVALESKRVIEIDEFVPKSDIDELYMRDPYYLVPDGEVGQQAFAVIREAIRKEGMVALGRVVFTSRKHVIALEARGKGLMGITLRYPYEVRKEADYFDEITEEKVPKDMLELAAHIVETKRGKFHPDKFEDHYEEALKELIRKKQKGIKIERPKERAPSNVVNLMDALRQSVQAERGGAGARRKPARSADHRAPKKAGRSIERAPPQGVMKARRDRSSVLCPSCDSTGWVCENHPERPYRGDSARIDACDCGAGMPCRRCNPCGGIDEPPRLPPGFVVTGDGRKRH